MKYYKLVKDNQIFGVCNSNNFKYYNTISNLILSSDEIRGQLIRHKKGLYRDYWMPEIPATFTRQYEMVRVEEISESEYTTLFEALEKVDYIDVEEEGGTEVITIVPSSEHEELTIEALKRIKIQELSNACNKAIKDGFEVVWDDNTISHYSLSEEDQLNIIELNNMIHSGQPLIPYHADNEPFKFYTADEATKIAVAATKHKMYHTSYFNCLKSYVNSLEEEQVIATITYGGAVPEEYQSDVFKMVM